jgi:flagellin-like protein
MNRIRTDKNAVSPVIATILMVAITVVLAGVLVVYLQTLPSGGGDVQTTIGTRCTKNVNGDWLIDITSGNKNAGDVTIQVTNANTGAQVMNCKVTAIVLANGVFNDLNVALKLDAGDSILLRSTTAVAPGPGVCMAGMKVSFLIGDNVVGTVKELPN